MATFVGKVNAEGRYVLPDPAAAREAYLRDGYIVLQGFLAQSELAPIEVIYDKFMRREIAIPGRDVRLRGSRI
jgi:phytanoyl-CoA hydroxylase